MVPVDLRRRVFLHVGTPKTGTTYLQDVLWANRRRLARSGCYFPAPSPAGHFPAAMDLCGTDYQGWAPRAFSSAWDRLVRRVGELEGTVVLSHELFGDVPAEAARRAVADLAADAEVHLVLTARALDRQLPAVWQENVKNRDTTPFPEFVGEVSRGPGAGPAADLFWLRQDVPAVLDRWAADLPPDRVHVVPVPRRAAPEVLWERFAGVLGVDVPVRTAASRDNASLRAWEAELLRRLNGRIADRLPWPVYARRVRRYLLPVLAAGSAGSPALTVPAEAGGWLTEQADRMTATVRDRGWQVSGDLDDLRVPAPAPSADGATDPGADPDALLTAALDALAGVVLTDPAGPAALAKEVRRLGRGAAGRLRALR